MQFALTDHLEGPAEQPSLHIYDEVGAIVREADALGIEYAWFSEHHAHAHYGHLPAPLLFALHLAGQTERIRLGTAIICLNLHSPLAIAEQVAVADLLTGGRMSVGFGSGSSPQEFGLFGLDVTGEVERHARFSEALQVIRDVWSGDVAAETHTFFPLPAHKPLPRPTSDLAARSWLAVNSVGSARIAGALGFNMMFSHLRTPDDYRTYREVYQEAGGTGLVAANRPVYVGADDRTAEEEIEGPLRLLWRRFQREGKIPADRMEPETVDELRRHPINFLIGGPETVAREIVALNEFVPFDVINAELRWEGLTPSTIHACLRRLAQDVRSLL